jgi:hypothetical protein
MDLLGKLRELTGILFRTTGDSKTVEINAPTTLTGANSVFVLPDETTGELTTDTATQSLTNKTIAAGSNTISGLTHGSEVDNPSSGVHGVTGSVVGTSDSQTLTNKTLDTPQLTNSIDFLELAATGVTTPSAGRNKLFFDSADGLLKYKDDAGVVNPVGTTPSMQETYDVNSTFSGTSTLDFTKTSTGVGFRVQGGDTINALMQVLQSSTGPALSVEANYGFQTATFRNSNASKKIIRLADSAFNAIDLTMPDPITSWEWTLPPNDGDAGQFLQTDGSGVTTWATPTGGANTSLSNLSATAINTNLNSTSIGGVLSANVASSGTMINLTNSGQSRMLVFTNSSTTNTNALARFRASQATSSATLLELAHENTSADYIRFEAATSGTIGIRIPGTVTSWNFTLPTNDGDAGQVLQTDGAGVTSWATPAGGIANVVEDTTPQLGGDLDLNGSNIVDGATLVTHFTGTENTFFGENAGNLSVSGTGYNCAMGFNAGLDLTTGQRNSFFGHQAGNNVSSGSSNTFLGDFAGNNISTTSNNVAIGALAFITSSASANNTIIGTEAGRLGALGSDNTAVGYQALYNTAATGATAIGEESGKSSGNYSTFVGRQAGQNSTGAQNTIIGADAGVSITGNNNTVLGYDAADAITSGTQNVVIGASAGSTVQTGTENVYAGFRSGFNTGVGDNYNTIIGGRAGENSEGSQNTFIGHHAGRINDSSDNVLIGYRAAYNANITGGNAVVIGRQAGENSTGSANIAIGREALLGVPASSTGVGNIAIGYRAGWGNTTGSSSVLIGYQAAKDSTGYSNVVLGSSTGVNLTTGGQNVLLGHQADVSSGAATALNAVAIGYQATVDASNKIRIGNDAMTTMEFTDGFTVKGADEATADANAAGDLTIQASNKTAGTGDGGNLILRGGTGFGGGSTGTVQVAGDITVDSTGAMGAEISRATNFTHALPVAIYTMPNNSMYLVTAGTFDNSTAAYGVFFVSTNNAGGDNVVTIAQSNMTCSISSGTDIALTQSTGGDLNMHYNVMKLV